MQSNATHTALVTYDFPITERVRLLLRLENLFTRFDYFMRTEATANDMHVALLLLIELLEMTSRGDIKSDILQELEKQKQMLPAVFEERAAFLNQMNHALEVIHAMTGKIGQHLRTNEWFNHLRQRLSVPGGVSPFELAAYQDWLQRPVKMIHQDILAWFTPMLPLRRGVEVLLSVLRLSSETSYHEAINGAYQQNPHSKSIHLIRLAFSSDILCTPEVSANKYAIVIRFLYRQQANGAKPMQYAGHVPFEMQCCRFNG